MEGYEAFKKLRMKSGLSVRGFSAAADISPRSLSYYENGEKSLLYVPVEKAIRIFSLFNVKISAFYQEYYPYIVICTEVAVSKWKTANKREVSREIISRRLKNRIYKIKERKQETYFSFSEILEIYEKQMSLLSDELGDRDEVSEEEYDQYVMPVIYTIRKTGSTISSDPVTSSMMEAYYHTEYRFSDLAFLSGITQQSLKGRINRNELNKLHIETMLKLCLILGINFEELFGVKTDENST